MLRIVFITPYPQGEAPSQRFRFEQYFPLLEKAGFNISIKPFLEGADWKVIYRPGEWTKKVKLLIKSFFKRSMLIFTLFSADFVFIHREAMPFGPPIIEWVIAKILRKKIIYDFDDAIWATDKVSESLVSRIIKWRSKTKAICQWSYRVSCGNQYLCDFASQYNKNVIRNPTTIDTVNVHNKERFDNSKKDNTRIVIGWTGSHSTLKYLTAIQPALKIIAENLPQVDFMVIADRDPHLNLPRYYFRPWSLQTEITDLLKFDIGIMPLPDNEWSRGKCGFKALQYMSLGVPAVATPVGVNTEIIDHSKNGFLCGHESEWVAILTRLVEDADLRKKIGAAGKETVINHYSVESNGTTFLSFFQA
ncbi:glycosyltransferase family 1 protein [Pseudochryseolinea flava]|uniref:Glycosyltransferase family 1 protein n=1 Tax=Pseudochryseolinea flava TaxID=2059302 RepID=A0A364YCX6_9BACT|nr:glycosyltransferase family 1 protein [Pseudochryseolinea flava]